MFLCGSNPDGSGSITGTLGVSPIGSLGPVGGLPSGVLLLGSSVAGAVGPQGPPGPVSTVPGPPGPSVGNVDGGTP